MSLYKYRMHWIYSEVTVCTLFRVSHLIFGNVLGNQCLGKLILPPSVSISCGQFFILRWNTVKFLHHLVMAPGFVFMHNSLDYHTMEITLGSFPTVSRMHYQQQVSCASVSHNLLTPSSMMFPKPQGSRLHSQCVTYSWDSQSHFSVFQ